MFGSQRVSGLWHLDLIKLFLKENALKIEKAKERVLN
jgi:hypothetical protein